MEFTLKVIGGEMTAIPGISDAIEVFLIHHPLYFSMYYFCHVTFIEQFQGTIRDTIEDTLTWPNRIIVPIVPGDYR